MIQRIQTLFLLLSTIATMLLLLMPMVTFLDPSSVEWTMKGSGVRSSADGTVLFNSWPLTALIALVTLISLSSIFLFKRRTLQLRLTNFNLLLMLGMVGMGLMYAYKAVLQLEASWAPGIISIMPVISFILSFMAARAIRRDDILIKGLDRIR